MNEIGRFIDLEGLKQRKQQHKASRTPRVVVSHDEVVTCGKGLVQRLVEQLKREGIE